MAKNNTFEPNRKRNFSNNKTKNVKEKFNKKPQSIKHLIERQNERSSDNFFIKPSKSNFKAKNGKMFHNKESPNKNNTEDMNLKPEKCPFDKKLYRLKKYSNKFKVHQWEEKRKKVALRDLKKSQKWGDSEKKLDVQKIYEEHKEDLISDTDNEEEIETNNEVRSDTNEDIPTIVAGQRSLADKFERKEQRKNKKSIEKFQKKFQDVRAQKEAQREEFLRKKQEKQEALKLYQKKKAEKFKKLSMKTKKGQPVMKGRMELLLEQIQNNINE